MTHFAYIPQTSLGMYVYFSNFPKLYNLFRRVCFTGTDAF